VADLPFSLPAARTAAGGGSIFVVSAEVIRRSSQNAPGGKPHSGAKDHLRCMPLVIGCPSKDGSAPDAAAA
jgi:hypothetical protein